MRIASWNIQHGGFHGYNPEIPSPHLGRDIKSALDTLHHVKSAETTVVIDAYRWDEYYGNDHQIARYMGYVGARFTQLSDDRLSSIGEDGIGIAIASDRRITDVRVLDLGTRNGLSVMLDSREGLLQVAGLYLDDMSETVRRDQVACLKKELEPGVPTVLVGDFNTLRPALPQASTRDRVADKLVRTMVAMTPAFGEVPTKLKTMDIRTIVPQIESMGYIDSDPLARPTVPARLPVLGLDYAFHTPDLKVENFQVLNNPSFNRLSDHRPILFDVHQA